MTGDHRRQWSARRRTAVAAIAAVAVFGAVVGAVLLYDAGHPPPPVRTGPGPTASQQPAGDLLRGAAAALRSASTAHVRGTVGGSSGAVTVDLSVTAHGDARGQLVAGGVPVSVVRTGGRTYLQSAALVRRVAGAAVASYVGDDWVAVGHDQLVAMGVSSAVDTATSLGGIASLVDSGAGLARRAGDTTVGGRPAVEIVTGPTTVDVARDGPPYPLRVQAAGVLTLALDGFGAPVVVRAPSSGVVDLGRLPGLG